MHARRLRELCVLALCVLGCRPEPLRPVVEEIELEGLNAVGETPIREGLATTETPELFGFEGILEYATYDPHVLARDLLRIERYLRARGYYEAKVTAARVVDLGKNRVRIELRVNEGQPVRVVVIAPGIASLPPEAVLPANKARKIKDGDVFDEDRFEADKRRTALVLLDMGYAFANVEGSARVDIPSRRAELSYAITPGPRALYGPVTFIGLEEIPEGPVRATLKIRPGGRYSESDLEDARNELVDLGVFSTVEVVPDRSHPESATVPIQVRVHEASLRTLRLGGGVRFDVLQLAVNLETSWEHRNFLGGMRRFNVSAEPGLIFYPTRIGSFDAPTRVLPENRVTATLSQPSFIEGRTTGTLEAKYQVAPVPYPLQNIDPDNERIIGYHQISGKAGLSRGFFRRRTKILEADETRAFPPALPPHRLAVELSYNWQGNFPFMYQKSKPAGLDPVSVSFPELVTTLDFRDDLLHTTSGVYLSNSLQVAGSIFGGDVSDVKVSPEARAFLPIDRSTLAFRVGLGFLFTENYGKTLTDSNLEPEKVGAIHDQQKLSLRAFYSGGPNSNRGYPFRTIGPHGPIGFLAPSNDPNCAMFQGDDRCLRPLGGLTRWEASAEARVPFAQRSPLVGVLFVDASDLTRKVGEIRFTAPHLSPGAGLRYWTAVGTLRLDVGWRVPGLQAFGADDTPENVGRPGDPMFGFFPGAIHVIFGSEAF